MYRLLIVDDEQVIREGLRTVVDWSELGFEVTGTERNGQRALDFMADNPVDVILADIRMSRMSGLELSHAVAERYPAVKVVILSGYDHFEYARDAIRSGVVFHYLLKPCREPEIRDVFSRLAGLLAQERAEKHNSLHLRKLEIRDLFSKLTKKAAAADILRFSALTSCSEQNPLYLVCLVHSNPGTEKQEPESVLRNLTGRLDGLIFITGAAAETCYLGLLGTIREGMDKNQDVSGAVDSAVRTLNSGYTFMVSRALKELESLPAAAAKLAGRQREEVFFYPDCVYSAPAAGDAEPAPDFRELSCRLAGSLFMENAPERTEAVAAVFRQIREHHPPSRESLARFFRQVLNSVSGELKEQAFSDDWIQQNLEGARSCLSQGFFLYRIESALVSLGQIIEEASELQTRTSGGSLVHQTIRILNQDYSSGIGLNQVAERLGVTSVYLSRVFKKETGRNFKDYLTELRMSKARELLTSTGDKVYEVSEKVGFLDPRYFSELFKKFYGISPLDYRNRSLGTPP